MAMVNFFGVIAEVVSKNQMELDLDSISVDDFVSQLEAKHDLNRFEFKVVLNKRIVSKNSTTLIKKCDEIAFLPPFAGG